MTLYELQPHEIYLLFTGGEYICTNPHRDYFKTFYSLSEATNFVETYVQPVGEQTEKETGKKYWCIFQRNLPKGHPMHQAPNDTYETIDWYQLIRVSDWKIIASAGNTSNRSV
jgi:hypothetical protein